MLLLNSLISLVAADHDIDIYAELTRKSSTDFMLLQMGTFHAYYYLLRKQSVGGILTEFFQSKSLRCGQVWSFGMGLIWSGDHASLCALDLLASTCPSMKDLDLLKQLVSSFSLE